MPASVIYRHDIMPSRSAGAPRACTLNPMRLILRPAVLVSLLLVSLPFAAQEQGAWMADSQNARTITGPVALAAQKITINFLSFPMVKVRTLAESEMAAAFDAPAGASHNGSLYRLNISSATKLLRKNSLCGGDDTEWMATYVSGRSLQLAFFSGDKPPVFTLDALANSTDLCGTFTYLR